MVDEQLFLQLFSNFSLHPLLVTFCKHGSNPHRCGGLGVFRLNSAVNGIISAKFSSNYSFKNANFKKSRPSETNSFLYISFNIAILKELYFFSRSGKTSSCTLPKFAVAYFKHAYHQSVKTGIPTLLFS